MARLDRVTRSRWWPLLVLALAAGAFALNWLQKSPCRSGDWGENLQFTQRCYTDIQALYYAEHLHEGAVPYLDHPVEYPVLIGLVMFVIGRFVWQRGEAAPDGAPVAFNGGQLFYDLNAVALAVLGLVGVWAFLRLRPHRPMDAVLLALAPAVFVSATVNWDLLPAALTTLALLAWSRQRHGLAGVLLGLGAAAKLYPVFILGPLLLLCLRRRRLPEFGVTFGAALLTWAAVNLPVQIAAHESWLRFWRLSAERPIDWGTLWYIGSRAPVGSQVGIPPFTWLSAPEQVPTVNLLSNGLFLLGCVGIGLLCLRARTQPRLAQVAFLVVAVFLLTGKVWSQQFVIWLVPLALLARPRVGAFLLWQACEVAYFLGFYEVLLHVSGGSAAFGEQGFALVAAGRWLSLALLVGLVVRDIVRPDRDVVRAEGPDPVDGVLGPQHHGQGVATPGLTPVGRGA